MAGLRVGHAIFVMTCGIRTVTNPPVGLTRMRKETKFGTVR